MSGYRRWVKGQQKVRWISLTHTLLYVPSLSFAVYLPFSVTAECDVKHTQVLRWDAFITAQACLETCSDGYVQMCTRLLVWCRDVNLLLLFPTKASSTTLAGILCAIGVAAVGAVTGYFTYQRKQLCFKDRQGNYHFSSKENTKTNVQWWARHVG